MDMPELPHLIFRWLHVLAAVMWVGQLWSLALILGVPAQSNDPSFSTILLRAHAWHRWSGTLTWISGLPLLGIVYYSGGAVTPDQSLGVATGAGLVAIAAAFGVYDTVWSRLAHHRAVAVVLSFSLLAAVAFALSRVMIGRAVYVHIGALLATIMLANVWRHIWPAEHLRLTTATDRQPASAALETASARLHHNVSFSVAVLLLMISNHFPLLYGGRLAWLVAVGIVMLASLITSLVDRRRDRFVFAHS
jgi:uncharacterized membrane protein